MVVWGVKVCEGGELLPVHHSDAVHSARKSRCLEPCRVILARVRWVGLGPDTSKGCELFDGNRPLLPASHKRNTATCTR